jgi:hypothetical protein
MRSSALLWLAALMVIALAAPGESEGGPPPGPPGRPAPGLGCKPVVIPGAASASYKQCPWGLWPGDNAYGANSRGGHGSRTTNDNGRGGFGSQSPPLLPSGTPMTPPPPGHMAHAGSSGPPPWRSMAPPVAKAVIPDPPAPSHTAETPETTPVVDLTTTSAPPPPAETMNHTVDLRICKLCQKQTYAGRGQCFNKNCEPWIYNGSSFYVWAAPSK